MITITNLKWQVIVDGYKNNDSDMLILEPIITCYLKFVMKLSMCKLLTKIDQIDRNDQKQTEHGRIGPKWIE